MSGYDWLLVGLLGVVLVTSYNIVMLVWEWWEDHRLYGKVHNHASKQWLEKRRKKESKDG